mmetsp:Transcript_87257/g.267061  ORF Transcript_87257/g.267061 Transcript_87257/m.267061 type:complete len:201 (-) Transcript_87257:93-695(-)
MAVRVIDFEKQDFTGVIAATVLYFLLQELFMCNQVFAKLAFSKNNDPSTFDRFDYSNRHWESADRSFGNFVEQTPYFVTMMWVFALFCGAESSAQGAYFYIAFRLLFPVFWAVGGKWNALIELSTQPCYAVLNYWKASLIYLVFTGNRLVDKLPPSTALFVLACIAIHVVLTLVTFVPGYGFFRVLKLGFPEAGSDYNAM